MCFTKRQSSFFLLFQDGDGKTLTKKMSKLFNAFPFLVIVKNVYVKYIFFLSINPGNINSSYYVVVYHYNVPLVLPNGSTGEIEALLYCKVHAGFVLF